MRLNIVISAGAASDPTEPPAGDLPQRDWTQTPAGTTTTPLQNQQPSPEGTGESVVESSADPVPTEITPEVVAPPSVTSNGLAPESDTGMRGDGRTSVRKPSLVGTTDPGASVRIVRDDGAILASGKADAFGRFRIALEADLPYGTTTLRAVAVNAAGDSGSPSPGLALRIERVANDYTGDGQADLVTVRSLENQLLWTIVSPTTGSSLVLSFGKPGDVPLSGDFDGDGRSDLAVYRPATATFLIQTSSGETITHRLGSPGDAPAIADFDGDGRTDLAVLARSSGAYLIAAGTDILTVPLMDKAGASVAGGVAVPADYDGDGRDDAAVFDPATSMWIIRRSSDGSVGVQPDDTVAAQDTTPVPIPNGFDTNGVFDMALSMVARSDWQPAFHKWEAAHAAMDTESTQAPAPYPGAAAVDNSSAPEAPRATAVQMPAQTISIMAPASSAGVLTVTRRARHPKGPCEARPPPNHTRRASRRQPKTKTTMATPIVRTS